MTDLRTQQNNLITPTVVFWTTGKTTKKFQDQNYFGDFNWVACSAGDVIWIEDYTANDAKTKLCGVIVQPFDFGNPVIRLVPNSIAKNISDRGLASVSDINEVVWHIRKYMYQ